MGISPHYLEAPRRETIIRQLGADTSIIENDQSSGTELYKAGSNSIASENYRLNPVQIV